MKTEKKYFFYSSRNGCIVQRFRLMMSCMLRCAWKMKSNRERSKNKTKKKKQDAWKLCVRVALNVVQQGDPYCTFILLLFRRFSDNTDHRILNHSMHWVKPASQPNNYMHACVSLSLCVYVGGFFFFFWLSGTFSVQIYFAWMFCMCFFSNFIHSVLFSQSACERWVQRRWFV